MIFGISNLFILSTFSIYIAYVIWNRKKIINCSFILKDKCCLCGSDLNRNSDDPSDFGMKSFTPSKCKTCLRIGKIDRTINFWKSIVHEFRFLCVKYTFSPKKIFISVALPFLFLVIYISLIIADSHYYRYPSIVWNFLFPITYLMDVLSWKRIISFMDYEKI